METDPNKSKDLSFTRARVKDPLNYSLGDQTIPQASCCKYLGIIIRSDFGPVVRVPGATRRTRHTHHRLIR